MKTIMAASQTTSSIVEHNSAGKIQGSAIITVQENN